MTGSPTFQALTRESLERHQQIQFFLDQLERTLKALQVEGVAVETLRRVAAQIEGLLERLGEHFESEEKGGLFRAVLDVLPEAAGEIHQLSVQHARVVEMLEMARTRAQWGTSSEADVLRAELEAFLRKIRDHESREEALIARAIGRESRV